MTTNFEIEANCLCGEVRLSIRTKNNRVGACHCSMCRKWGGGPLLAVECDSDISIDGSQYVAVFSSSEWAERGFCSNCGTHLFYRLNADGHCAIPVGLLDDGEDWVFDEQIFIDEKPAFYAFSNVTKNLTGAEVFAQYMPDDE